MTGGELLVTALVDVLVGDPHWLPHPVRVMGSGIAWYDQGIRRICRSAISLRLAGICLAIGLPIVIFTITLILIEEAERFMESLGSAVSIVLASMTLATRDLWDHVRAVEGPLQAGDLPAARRAVGMIVGRDTAGLSESEVARATVETVAESSADGIIAPLLYLAIGGAPLALAYKAINTLDSMIGHRNDRYVDLGWASARLDDLANWIPARLAALLLIGGAGLMSRQLEPILRGWRVLRRDGGKHPSPNSGRPEAAMAGILGVRLGGTNFYDGVPQDRPVLGTEGREPEPWDVASAATVMAMATVLGVFLAVGIRWLM
ncbi:MAG: adenosylcobinamide-phosphate synthase CbiB [Nitrospira sp.]|nr:adenosylcobinamide-phosphate synthase CbiB [Nitrospira sp.]MDH4304032.1 adenosylcobinamide-phosphate synthase CbiB [Nitrospira sp.]MDH5194003.1 adenosylcobinamide-phosphate synthase CbiB [Nitrospira sp.]